MAFDIAAAFDNSETEVAQKMSLLAMLMYKLPPCT